MKKEMYKWFRQFFLSFIEIYDVIYSSNKRCFFYKMSTILLFFFRILVPERINMNFDKLGTNWEIIGTTKNGNANN